MVVVRNCGVWGSVRQEFCCFWVSVDLLLVVYYSGFGVLILFSACFD